MANAVDFQGSNCQLKAPLGLITERRTPVADIPAHNDKRQIITCWRLTEDELKEVVRTGAVWMSVKGQIMNTAYVSGIALVQVSGIPSEAGPYVEPKVAGILDA